MLIRLPSGVVLQAEFGGEIWTAYEELQILSSPKGLRVWFVLRGCLSIEFTCTGEL
jgi:hypothetical protein